MWLDSKNNLSIQFWVIDFIYILDSRDLDCFGLFAKALAMTKWSAIRVKIHHCEANHRFTEAIHIFTFGTNLAYKLQIFSYFYRI